MIRKGWEAPGVRTPPVPRERWRGAVPVLLLLALAGPSHPAASQPPAAGGAVARPTLDSIRSAMAIPSRDGIRGRIDSTAYTSRSSQMDSIWARALRPPAPD